MIRFSKMADYGVLLLGHFAQNGNALASTAELAEHYHMPRTVVANLLKEFCKAELVESRRGLHGGYRLARPADEITLLEMLSVIDGPVQLTECAAEEIVQQCDYSDVCHSRSPMRAVNQRIVDFLGLLTLSELMNDVAPAAIAPLGGASSTTSP